MKICKGKYLQESGVDHVFINTHFLCINEVKQVLNGTHYASGIKEIFMLGQALQRFLPEEFPKNYNSNCNGNELSIIKTQQSAFFDQEFEQSKVFSTHFNDNYHKFLDDFNDFIP